MNIPEYQWLTWLTFLPSFGALLVLLFRRENAVFIKATALFTSALSLLLALFLWLRFDTRTAELQFAQKIPWIPIIHVDYFVGVDGISILLVLLTAIVVPLAILASWSVTTNAKMYFFLVLILETGMFGVFTALNFFHWFIFWELSLISAFFLIKMWGGERTNQASIKFLLYTLVGSVTMLLAFQAIYLATGSFDFLALAKLGKTGELTSKLGDLAKVAGLTWSPMTCGALAFAAVLLAFVIKAPLWPFHTWLPDAYAEAPPATTMLLTAVLSKMGIYGLLRIVLPIFPQYSVLASEVLLWLALITVISGALAAYAQTDLKRMIAYSSINHVGYCLLGIFAVTAGSPDVGISTQGINERAAALNGVILQMFNHGISAAALFFLLGALEARTQLRGLDDFGGLRQPAPVFCGIFGIVMFSSLGLPGLNGFVSEFLIFKGSLALQMPVAALATTGVLITAIFLLTIMQRVFWGPMNNRWSKLSDLNRREIFIAAIFLVPIFWVGLYPAPFLNAVNPSVRSLVDLIQGFAR